MLDDLHLLRDMHGGVPREDVCHGCIGSAGAGSGPFSEWFVVVVFVLCRAS